MLLCLTVQLRTCALQRQCIPLSHLAALFATHSLSLSLSTFGSQRFILGTLSCTAFIPWYPFQLIVYRSRHSSRLPRLLCAVAPGRVSCHSYCRSQLTIFGL